MEIIRTRISFDIGKPYSTLVAIFPKVIICLSIGSVYDIYYVQKRFGVDFVHIATVDMENSFK